ncbi:MAG: addiction module toxin RelE [Acidobacteria bacterium]|nr:MAG: addiction module toxin RelE [Acidobacteriota bacterium]REJ98415.1 MAG: addiction module toxin RelE [Acidobacteriota bacterium]REK17161.1 MAG: addiction module toxin RelE [Acidobacteriota bacterium]REK43071.1 MAG: addiction module toxin RelE [Acidobacteriota bacterium]
MDKLVEKQLDWVGSSLDDLRSFPDPVQQRFGFQLYQVQIGEMPCAAKPMKGKDFRGVFELRDNFVGDTFRAVFIAKLREKVYVLHCFKKKSKSGIATPKKDLELIRHRLKLAIDDSKRLKK